MNARQRLRTCQKNIAREPFQARAQSDSNLLRRTQPSAGRRNFEPRPATAEPQGFMKRLA
jgi:hypothetical protein